MYVLLILTIFFLALKAVAFFRREEREEKDIDDSNPYLHPELAEKLLSPEMAVYVNMHQSLNKNGKHGSDEQHSRTGEESKNMYEAFLKPILDNILSFLGLLLLSPVFIIVIIAIKVDDPGPVFFTQCRITRDKKFFRLHKFRSMKMSTPHDMPTHMLTNPEQYITRVGKFLRRSSLDELPQIWDIFRGRMSIIGPRPALWNQADLIFERDKWGANDIKPGLTGLAQIHGRDQLEIKDKAELDGIYTQQIMKSSISGFSVDIRCFFGTFLPVLRSEGIIEGRHGEEKQKFKMTKEELIEYTKKFYDQYLYVADIHNTYLDSLTAEKHGKPSNPYFRMVAAACIDCYTMTLARLYEEGGGDGTINKFISECKKHKDFFLHPDETFDFLTDKGRELKQNDFLKNAIDVISHRRNKYMAHNDPKYFSGLSDDKRMPLYEVWMLIWYTGELLNKVFEELDVNLEMQRKYNRELFLLLPDLKEFQLPGV